MRILLDMDGVLVDFVAGAAAAHGTTMEHLLPRWPVGEWDMRVALGNGNPLAWEDFWAPINRAGVEFWLRLPATPWMCQLIRLVEQWGEWHVVSSPSWCPTSYMGKVRWLKERWGERFNRFALTPHKHLFARSDAVLIDDRAENVEEFVAAGGRGVVFPARYNKLFALAADPVAYVAIQLEVICGVQVP